MKLELLNYDNSNGRLHKGRNVMLCILRPWVEHTLLVFHLSKKCKWN